MKALCRYFVILVLAVVLAGCASVQTSQNPNATPEQIQTAAEKDCKDATLRVERAAAVVDRLKRADVLDEKAIARAELGVLSAEMLVDVVCAGIVPIPTTAVPAQ